MQGRSYTARQLQEMLEWCLDNGVHLISDEVQTIYHTVLDTHALSIAVLVSIDGLST